MSGPRVTSGVDSQQDYQTDPDFMTAVTKRWGPICFDLAAHAGNNQHERYFAPTEFVYTGTLTEIAHRPGTAVQLFKDAKKTKPKLREKKKTVNGKVQIESELIYEKRVPNVDPKAYALDAFKHSWAALSKKFADGDKPGLLWLNCEFDDTERWATRCREEAEQGAHILLLTPLALTNWFNDNIVAVADTILLLGRLSFDGKNAYPKDCMLSYFHPSITYGTCVELWDWREQMIVSEGSWVKCLRSSIDP